MGVNNLRNIRAMKLFFFWKGSKFNADLENVIKNAKNVFNFSVNDIWSGSGKLSVLLREYSELAVNVLRSSPEISDLTKKEFF